MLIVYPPANLFLTCFRKKITDKIRTNKKLSPKRMLYIIPVTVFYGCDADASFDSLLASLFFLNFKQDPCNAFFIYKCIS